MSETDPLRINSYVIDTHLSQGSEARLLLHVQ